jgi:hypothetical protein
MRQKFGAWLANEIIFFGTEERLCKFVSLTRNLWPHNVIKRGRTTNQKTAHINCYKLGCSL